MNSNHSKVDGKFITGFWARKLHQLKTGLRRAAVISALGWFAFGFYSFGSFDLGRTLVAHAEIATSTIPALEGLSVSQLEDKLDALVWLEESQRHVMKEGEIFQTFDPPQGDKWWAICTKIGGKVNQECYSNGPRQTKIPTIQGKWKTLHGVEISEKDARDVAESNDGSRRFFLDCAIKVKECANLWTGFRNHKIEGQMYIDLIREAKHITV